MAEAPRQSAGANAGTDVPAMARLMQRLEAADALDPAVAAVAPVAQQLVAVPAVRRVLLGRDLGHAVHPPMTDLPIGFWTSAFLLDLLPTPGAQAAARRLVGVGVLTAVPTAVTGLAEWTRTTPEIRRVGLVHAAQNGTALAAYTGSWLARRAGHHGVGKALGAVGALAATLGGTLGGHMAIDRKVGSSYSA